MPGFDPDGPPARVIHLRDEGAGLDAVVVIDHALFPLAAGGTRLAPDVTEAEVAALARAMTWKFALYGYRVAGAKAGIRLPPGGDRTRVLRAYRAALAPLGDVFATGPDLGTDPADFLGPGDAVPMWARSHEGLGMDDLATGHGVKAAAAAALAHLGRPLEGATVAIEGFGKVGGGGARAFARAGARVVAISTVEGALADPGGLDVEGLLALRERHGDALVRHAAVPVRPRQDLFATPCDVLVPGARPHVITRELAAKLLCTVVAPGANVPYADGVCEVLAGRGIVAVPDFVANAGGVHLYETAGDGESPEACLERIEQLVAAATARVLAAAADGRVTPVAAARTLALDFLELEGGR